jgi:hypothetical protein
MSAIVQINFKHNMSENDLAAGALEWAENVKPDIAGLKWKIFLNDPDTKESTGIYLFESLESAEAYAKGDMVRAMEQSPDRSDISVRVSQVMETASIAAGAPV